MANMMAETDLEAETIQGEDGKMKRNDHANVQQQNQSRGAPQTPTPLPTIDTSRTNFKLEHMEVTIGTEAPPQASLDGKHESASPHMSPPVNLGLYTPAPPALETFNWELDELGGHGENNFHLTQQVRHQTPEHHVGYPSPEIGHPRLHLEPNADDSAAFDEDMVWNDSTNSTLSMRGVAIEIPKTRSLPSPSPKRRKVSSSKFTADRLSEAQESEEARRDALRREKKSARERQRRGAVNLLFLQLCDVLGLGNETKDKATILRRAIECIREFKPLIEAKGASTTRTETVISRVNTNSGTSSDNSKVVHASNDTQPTDSSTSISSAVPSNHENDTTTSHDHYENPSSPSISPKSVTKSTGKKHAATIANNDPDKTQNGRISSFSNTGLTQVRTSPRKRSRIVAVAQQLQQHSTTTAT